MRRGGGRSLRMFAAEAGGGGAVRAKLKLFVPDAAHRKRTVFGSGLETLRD